MRWATPRESEGREDVAGARAVFLLDSTMVGWLK